MGARVTGLFCALACALAWQPGAARAAPEAVPAVDGVLQAFHDHPLVAIGDNHVMAEQGAFYIALVSDPRFAATVQDIVVEFGAGGHQAIMDRYLAGEAVPYDQLRLTWTDTVGAIPAVNRIEYIAFFAAVRAVNMRLPADKRIRVWLGQPPVDWSSIHSRAEHRPLSVGRDQFAVDLVEREIMAKGRKALLIWGMAHFLAEGAVLSPVLGPRLKAMHPSGLYLIAPYFGFNEAACDTAFEGRAAHWPTPAVVPGLPGSATLKAMRRPGCTIDPGLGQDTKAMKPELLKLLRANDDHLAGADADALLYLGKEANMTVSPIDPAFYLDEPYFREMSRRNEIIIGKPLDWAGFVAANPPVVENFDAHIGRNTAPPGSRRTPG